MPTVLIADDDPRLVEMLRMTLAYEGFSVVVAHDGEEALREARRSRPDLIVLDTVRGVGYALRADEPGDSP